MTAPVVKIEGCSMTENSYSDGDRFWRVASLIAHAKDLQPFDLPLAAIYSGSEVWTPTGSAYGIAHHVRRALDVNTEYPVILDETGFIMDGWHRVLRALIEGKATIKAVRFDKTPPHDYTKAAA